MNLLRCSPDVRGSVGGSDVLCPETQPCPLLGPPGPCLEIGGQQGPLCLEGWCQDPVGGAGILLGPSSGCGVCRTNARVWGVPGAPPAPLADTAQQRGVGSRSQLQGP